MFSLLNKMRVHQITTPTQYLFHIQYFFLARERERENKIICVIDMKVREMDMNAFRCLSYFHIFKKN
jgi:hypothetical protein